MVDFIALDNQAILVVENVGLRRLLEVLDPRYVLPSRHYTAVSGTTAVQLKYNTKSTESKCCSFKY